MYSQCELSYHPSTSSLKYYLRAKRTADAEISPPPHQRQTTLRFLQQRCTDNCTSTVEVILESIVNNICYIYNIYR